MCVVVCHFFVFARIGHDSNEVIDSTAEFQVFKFGSLDPGGIYDATFSLGRIDALIVTLDWVRTTLPFWFPTNASSYLDSHFLFHENKPDPALY
jgi:hypothetical protein